MKAIIALPHTFNYDYRCDLLVGVDYGAYLLAKAGIKMDYAIGDFDSVSDAELCLIHMYSKEVIKLDVNKNETDSEAALMFVATLDENYSIIMLSDLGNRFDHLLNNFRLLNKYDFKLITEFSEIFRLDVGLHKIKNTHRYLSLFALDRASINLSNVKYTLTNVSFNEADTYLTSNEIVGKYAILEVLEGQLICVLSNE